ncbi:hypothetical protein VA596_33375 [Amycolatopsis sp., V23-08]|uniref:Uncharacterized protein n=1 Tax=Amycolatopsis heterodermiae TaxID=3110235 RepID=A0ABU5RFW3_9PSEU|nr:hypothetical protein [Amycolatopsis sp., V23-08]MEA5364464.1 hypothetical protein [Amycolatopsis sp., V23-08]
MTGERSFHGLLHRIPGVPAHVEQPAGHQGTTHHGRRSRGHSAARPPRVLVAWQRKIAAFFGQELP